MDYTSVPEDTCQSNKGYVYIVVLGTYVHETYFIMFISMNLKGLGPYLKHFLYNVNCFDIFV